MHHDVAASVDALLASQNASRPTANMESEVRFYDESGRMVVEFEAQGPSTSLKL